MHKCPDSKIRCFDCNSVICQECMAVTKDSLRCKNCLEKGAAKGKQTAARRQAASKGVLALATTFYSFVIMTFMNIMSFCLT
jgi:hypothetical protein